MKPVVRARLLSPLAMAVVALTVGAGVAGADPAPPTSTPWAITPSVPGTSATPGADGGAIVDPFGTPSTSSAGDGAIVDPFGSSANTSGVTSGAQGSADGPGAGCAVVHVIADQGTNESSERQNQKSDSGMLSQVIVPVVAKMGKKVDRTYVAYPADFGWRGNSYEQSLTKGVDNTNAVLKKEATRCPRTKFVILGYSQGGQVADTVLRHIGNGQGPVPAEQVAGGVLFSSPNRPAGAGLFPGADGQDAPAPVPGTTGAAVTKVVANVTQPGEGAGIAPNIAGTPNGYGDLTGRVASACIPGDLACDTPTDAPLARLVTNVAGQLDLNQQDPVGILASVATVVGTTTIKTAADVVNNDLSTSDGTTAGLTYSPQQTLLSRVGAASDPQYQTDVFGAVQKVLGIAVNTAITVAKKVITPQNIAEIASVGLANPVAGLSLFGAKLGQAALEMVPPNLADQAQTAVVDELKQDFTDNKGLISMAANVGYWNVAKHTMYGKTPLGAAGATAVGFATQWIIAAITDLVSNPGASSAADSSMFAATEPVAGAGSYNGLPGLSLPTASASKSTSTSYDPWSTSSTGQTQTPTYTSTPDGSASPDTDVDSTHPAQSSTPTTSTAAVPVS